MTYATVTAQCLVGIVFAVSAVAKVRKRSAFAAFEQSVSLVTSNLGQRSPRALRTLALLTVAAEFCVPVLLPAPVTAPAGCLLAAALLMVFCAAIAGALRRDVEARCSCFGAAGAELGWRHVVRNGLLVVIAVIGATGPARDATRPVSGLAVALVVAAVGAGLFVRFDDLVDVMLAPSGAGRAEPDFDR
ncbi:MauE/DoxX family redox-associated membrane protein [Streptomyces sp. CBMA152]|uniref:MauE/DoxX family redox-associated membrane protein n=1 Tax=Streptomyces sp. CBMA152 TaxID=1896312 RepID=UPI0016603ECA|nr:MauE/DoxX family redox-associated membrane protein [Streptomyces sp. CBMA152]MBD0746628.1 hypothetical protein [Streptomyces sp. CBMA152]